MALPTKIALSIVTPDHSHTREVDEVSLPGSEGDFGVLPGHTPFFTALRTGPMWYRVGAEKHHLVVSIGFVEVLPDRVTVLAQVAERAEDLDIARAEAGMARAQEMQEPMAHEMDFERARLALLKTLQQLQAESRRGV
jgi:F-type H+-transporting ATPase subunit epsilon